jgi:16S rRNA (guanine966-N2)-methyltransferase
MATGRRRGRSPRGSGGIRIIGGEWRGRRLPVADRPGLRPTADRVRETLFNWLQQETPGARCLDLYAGSGALGLEALSRGAGHCTFIERDRRACERLRDAIALLDAGDRALYRQDSAEAFLARGCDAFDLIFLDPPFGGDDLARASAALAAAGCCHGGTLVYVETDAPDPAALLPAGWERHRQATGGGVRFALFRPGPFVGGG